MTHSASCPHILTNSQFPSRRGGGSVPSGLRSAPPRCLVSSRILLLFLELSASAQFNAQIFLIRISGLLDLSTPQSLFSSLVDLYYLLLNIYL